MPPKKRSRCDSDGRAFAGSQRQIQFYVNEQPKVLQSAISTELNVPLRLDWVSPLKSDRYREYRDGAFLAALGLSNRRRDLSRFWPKGGPVWDALALNSDGGVVLLESKSHVAEIFGNGCGATNERSLSRIDDAMGRTKAWLNVSRQASWKGRVYQSANRLSHLHFFREVLGIQAWLVNVYFTADPHSPTSAEEWEVGMRDVKRALGLHRVPYYADVVLAALA